MTTAPTPTSNAKLHPARSLFAAVLVALLLGGGWYVYSNRVPRPESAADFRPDPRAPRPGTGAFFREPTFAAPRVRDPVSIQPRVATIRDGDMVISCSMRSDSNWNLSVLFNGESLGGTEVQRLALAVRRTVDAKQPPANLKLTDAQRAALAAIPLTPPELGADQLKQLVDLLNQSQKLRAGAPELTPIKSALQALAAQIKTVDRNAAKSKHAERDAKFRSILSAEQISTLLGVRGNRNAPT